MRLLRYTPLVALAAAWLSPHAAIAADSAAVAPTPPAAPSTDSLVFSANGSTLSGASGGGGGSLTWLHDFTSGVVGVGGEYQTLANAHWAFASLTGSVSTGSERAKWTFSGEGHVGRGDIGAFERLRRFDYEVEGAGVTGTFGGKLTLQLSARQFDVDTTHGALPKVGLGVLWTPHLQTTVSYSRSVSGNLGTELETVQLDGYGSTMSWLAGGALGHVAPPVVNLYTGTTGPAPRLREGYLGVSRTFGHTNWSILADYLKVANQTRLTLTVVCTLHVAGSAS